MAGMNTYDPNYFYDLMRNTNVGVSPIQEYLNKNTIDGNSLFNNTNNNLYSFGNRLNNSSFSVNPNSLNFMEPDAINLNEYMPKIDTGNGIKNFYNNNSDMLKFGMNSLMGIGNLAGSLGQYNLAKKQLNFQKDFAERNLANQTKSYNTELEHQARLRSAQTSSDGRANESSVEEYVRKNKL